MIYCTYFLISRLLVSKPPLKSPPFVHVLLIFFTVSFLIFSSPLSVEHSALLVLAYFITIKLK